MYGTIQTERFLRRAEQLYDSIHISGIKNSVISKIKGGKIKWLRYSLMGAHMTNKSLDLTPASVLIVEDQVQTSLRLREAISSCDDLSVSSVAHSLDTGLEAFYKDKPRLVLTDLGLPDGSGIDMIKAAAKADWPCDSLVISVFGDEKRVINAIRAGAKGYVLKNSGVSSIADDMCAVLVGGSPISPQIARHLLSMVNDLGLAESGTQEDGIKLTSRESEILNEVARGYKRAEIGQNLGISVGTVGNHINNIYKKLEVNSSIEAVTRATKMGIL